ncbi:MAG TPA: hypothetical protein ENI23_13225, partial [bacterium]|nr:hypothetical protein [bacterium]
MAYCKKCEKEVEPVLKNKRFYCPDCNLFVKATDDEKEEVQVEEIPHSEDTLNRPTEPPVGKIKKHEPTMIQEGKVKMLVAPKTIKYDASDLHMGEILINLGFAKDLNDLTRKNMKLAFSLMNMGAVGKNFNTMENENKEETTTEMMDKSLKQQLLKAQIDNMSSGGTQQASDPLSTMMLMKMMENQDKGKPSGDNGYMNQLMMMQMMQAMSKPQQDSQLQREIADLKNQMQMQQMLSQQQQVNQGNQSSQDFMQQMEKIRSERDKSIKQSEIAAQSARDKNLEMAFDNRRIELESKLQFMEKEIKQRGGSQMAAQNIRDMKEQIVAVKEMAKVLGDKDKSTSENIMEGLSDVAKTIGPPLVEVLKAKQSEPRPMPAQFPPDPMEYPVHPEVVDQPVEQIPQPLEQVNPEGMTNTEQEMSET